MQGLGHSKCAKGTRVEGRRSSSVIPAVSGNVWVCGGVAGCTGKFVKKEKACRNKPKIRLVITEPET